MVNSPFSGGSGGGGTGSTDTDDDTESEEDSQPEATSQRRRATPGGGGHTAGPNPEPDDSPDDDTNETSAGADDQVGRDDDPLRAPGTSGGSGGSSSDSGSDQNTRSGGGSNGNENSNDSPQTPTQDETGSGGESDTGTPGQQSEPMEEQTTRTESVVVDAPTESQARAQATQATGLSASELEITQADGEGFEVAFPDAQTRAARQLDERLSDVDVDRSDVEPAGDNEYRLSEDARERVAAERAADEFDLTRSDIAIENGRIVPKTEEAAGAIAEESLQDRTPEGTDVETEVVGPGVVTASGDIAGIREVGTEGEADTSLSVATPEGEEYLEEVDSYEGRFREAAGSDADADARRRSEQADADLNTGRLGDSRDILREDIASEVDEDVNPDDVSVQRSGGDLSGAVTGTPREEVVAGLEEQTGLELSTDDVEFEQTTNEDDEEVVSGELDSDAVRRYRQEQAPGQGTPLEGLFEAGAGLQYDYEQSDVTAGVEDTYNDVTPDVSSVEDTFNTYTPDTPSSDDILGAAAAGAPLAAAEPTPAGEVVVGGIALAGGLALAGEELSQRTAASGSASATTTEIDVPEEQFADELSVDGAAGQFPNELATPMGVTPRVNQGELSPSSLFVESELDATADTSVDEIQVGEDGDSASDIVNRDDSSYVSDDYPTTEASEAPASPGGNVPTGGETPTGPSGPQGPTLPADQPGQVGDGGAFGGIAGRELPQGRGFQNAEQSFFGVDLVDTFDPVDPLTSADQASIGGSQPSTFTGVEAGLLGSTTAIGETPVDVDANALGQGGSNANVNAPSTPTSTAQSTPATATSVEAPGVTANAPRFSTPAVEANAFSEQYEYTRPAYGAKYGYQTARRKRPRIRLPESGPTPIPDDEESENRFTEVFDNPTIGASEAVNFDAVGDDLDSLF